MGDWYYDFYEHVKEKHFDELRETAAPIREAKMLEYICCEIPLSIVDGDLIGARYGAKYGAMSGEIHHYRSDRSFPKTDVFTPEERELCYKLDNELNVWLTFAPAHTCIDYGRIIKEGPSAYRDRIERELEGADISPEKREYLSAMLISIGAVSLYSSRVSALAQARYEESGDISCARLAAAAKRVPYMPAESFFEALVSVWMMHSLIPLAENDWASISLGRLDQYLYPLFKKALDDGEDGEALKSYLKGLYTLINLFSDGACALNIGGTDASGADMMNELSELLIELETELGMPSPIFAVRVGDNTPDELLDRCIDMRMFSMGQPTFYGEQSCRRALERRGVPVADAVGFSVNSCMGLYMSGEEFANMWALVCNAHLPLELALLGKPLFCELPYRSTVTHTTPTCLDELIAQYEKYLAELLGICFAIDRKNAMNAASNNPDPLLSAITGGCISSGLDRSLGAKYNTETVEMFALANSVDAIAAIDTLVFRKKKYTLEQYIDATRLGFVNAPELLRDVRECEKYGTASAYADGIARRIVDITARLCDEGSHGNVYLLRRCTLST